MAILTPEQRQLILKELDKIVHEVNHINGTENLTARSNIVYSIGVIEGIFGVPFNETA